MNRTLNFLRGSEKPRTCALAVQEMLPMWKEKLLGQEFDNLGQLAQ